MSDGVLNVCRSTILRQLLCHKGGGWSDLNDGDVSTPHWKWKNIDKNKLQ